MGGAGGGGGGAAGTKGGSRPPEGVAPSADQTFAAQVAQSLDLAQWLLRDVILSRLFRCSFFCLFILPLIALVPCYAFLTPEQLDPNAIFGETLCGTGCVSGETTQQLLWYCAAWPPLVWVLFIGNFIPLIIARKQFTVYHESRYKRCRAELEEARQAEYDSPAEAAERARARQRERNAQQAAERRALVRSYVVFMCRRCPPSCPRRIRGPCVCRRASVVHAVVFFVAMVVPICMLLPVWFHDGLKFSLDVEGPTGKVGWIAAFMTIPGCYLLIACGFLISWNRSGGEEGGDGAAAGNTGTSRGAGGARGGNSKSGGKGRSKAKGGGAKGKKRSSASAAAKALSPATGSTGGSGGVTASAAGSGKDKDITGAAKLALEEVEALRARARLFCSWKRIFDTIIFLIFFVTPLVVGLVAYLTAPDDFFASAITQQNARLILLGCIVVPPYLYFLGCVLGWTIVPRQPPRRFSSSAAHRAALEVQAGLDRDLCQHMRWPRWLVYHYPWWSRGHGIVTTGERRMLVPTYSTAVDGRRLGIAFVLLVVLPLVGLAPLYFQGREQIRSIDLDPGVGEVVILSFFAGYPAAFFLFYLCRAIVSVIPAQVWCIRWTLMFHLIFFVGIPLGVLEPVYQSRRIYFSTNAAFLVQIIVYAYPISCASLWFFVALFSAQRIWRWITSLRVEEQLLVWTARIVERTVVPPLLLLPYVVWMYGTALIQNWESKDGDSTDGFLVFSTLISYVLMAMLFCGIMAATFLGHLRSTGGIERTLPLLLLATTAALGCWGASICDRYIIGRDPSIVDREDEDDFIIFRYVRYTTGGHAVTAFLMAFLFHRLHITYDLRRRFRRHPEDWEKMDPSLLTRGLTATQQRILQDGEREERRLESAFGVQRDWHDEAPDMDSDDEFAREVEAHAVRAYMNRHFPPVEGDDGGDGSDGGGGGGTRNRLGKSARA